MISDKSTAKSKMTWERILYYLDRDCVVKPLNLYFVLQEKEDKDEEEKSYIKAYNTFLAVLLCKLLMTMCKNVIFF